VDGTTSLPSLSLYVLSVPDEQRADNQLLMIASAFYILMVPGEYGRSLLPDRYERVTSGMGNTVRGQIVLGGLGSCK
jgi:hypothetical protein